MHQFPAMDTDSIRPFKNGSFHTALNPKHHPLFIANVEKTNFNRYFHVSAREKTKHCAHYEKSLDNNEKKRAVK